MPSLVLFGNRSLFGGDDLQPIAVASIFVRGLQILMLIPPCIYLVGVVLQFRDECIYCIVFYLNIHYNIQFRFRIMTIVLFQCGKINRK